METSFLDWPGRIAAVVFLGGCNFRCPYCHNGELLDGAPHLPDIPLREVLRRLAALRGWVDGVVVSGGEPTLHEGLKNLLQAFREAGLSVKLDTNGSRPGVLGDLVGKGLVQQVDVDLKAPLRREAYTRLAGVPVDPDVIAESLSLLGRKGIRHRVRTTFVPGLLDAGEVQEIIEHLAPAATYVLQAFNPGRVLDPRLGEVKPPSEREMARLRALWSARAAA